MGTKPSRTRLASSSAEPRLTLYFLMLANMILPSQSVSQELLCPTASGDRPMQHSTMALIDAATAEGCLSAQSDRSGWHPTLGNIQRPLPAPASFSATARPGRHCPSGQQLLTRMGDRP